MNVEELIDQLYPLMKIYYEEGTLTGRNLFNYINLFQQLKKLDPKIAKGYLLENNAVNFNPNTCAICLEAICKKKKYCKGKDCTHLFHWECATHKSIKKCPMCRTKFVPKLVENERVYFGKTSDLLYLQRLNVKS